MKPHIRLRLVPSAERPLGPLSRAEKIAKAIAFLRSRNRYVLDIGSEKPKWGHPGEPPRALPAVEQRGMPTFFERIAERLANAWSGK